MAAALAPSRTFGVLAMDCAVALILALSGCGFPLSDRSAGPRLVMPGTPDDVTEGMSHVQPNDVTSFGGMIVCLDRHGSVTVTGVQPVRAQGAMRITEWGVRPSPWWRPGPPRPTGESNAGIGGSGTLEHNHFTVGRQVDVTCDAKTGRGYELAVSLSLPGTAGATFKDLKISYITDGEHRSLVFPITLEMCPAKIDVENNCVGT